MSLPFLIVGLPRSRTAWLSALCNTVPDAICHHEPIIDFPSWQDALRLWRSPDYDFVGISDSGLGWHLEEILRLYRPRVLIVERPLHQVEASLATMMPNAPRTNYCTLLAERLRSVGPSPLVKRVTFGDLADDKIVHACLWHLLPGARIGRGKIDQMQRMNVQADLERTLRAVSRRSATAMLGEDVVAELRVA